jgi:hypothetical protein
MRSSRVRARARKSSIVLMSELSATTSAEESAPLTVATGCIAWSSLVRPPALSASPRLITSSTAKTMASSAMAGGGLST